MHAWIILLDIVENNANTISRFEVMSQKDSGIKNYPKASDPAAGWAEVTITLCGEGR